MRCRDDDERSKDAAAVCHDFIYFNFSKGVKDAHIYRARLFWKMDCSR